MRLRRWLGWSAASLLGLLLGVAAAAFFWVGQSTSFLRWAFEQGHSMTRGALDASGISGSLLGGIGLDRLVWDDGTNRVAVSQLALRWRPELLMSGELRLAAVTAARVVVTPGRGGEGEPAKLPERVALPLRVEVEALEVGEIVIAGEGMRVPILRDLSARLRLDEQALRVSGLKLRVDDLGALSAEATVASARPFETRLAARIIPALPDYSALPPLVIDLAGPLEMLALRLRLPAPAGQTALTVPGAEANWLVAETTLRPLDPVPVRTIALSLNGFEPAAIGLPGPQLRLSGSATVEPAGEAGAEPDAWRGRMALRNGLPGVIDGGRLPLTSLSTGFEWRNGRLALSGLDVDDGRLSGDLAVNTGATRSMFGLDLPEVSARLRLRDIDAQALHGQAWPTRLAGSIAVDVNRIEVDVTDSGPHKLALAADARVEDELVRIASLALRTPSGTLAASGTARWQAPWQLGLSGRFEQIEPLRLAALAGVTLPAGFGRLSGLGGTWSVEGAWRPALSVDSRLVLSAGAYDGRPLKLDWRGRVSSDRISGARLEASLGPLRARLSGAAGQAGDRLAVSVQTPSLAAIDAGLAQASGVEAALALEGDVAIAGLDAAALEGATLALRAKLGRIVHAAVTIEQARLAIDGTLAAHRATLALTGGKFGELALAGTLAAAGGLKLAGVGDSGAAPAWRWQGQLEQLAVRRPLAVRMTAPMPLTVSAQGVDAGAVTLHADDGRIELQRLRLRGGRIELSGSAARLPVSRWAERFGLVPADAARLDDVRIAGRWNLAGSSLEDLDGDLRLDVSTTEQLDADGRVQLNFANGALSGNADLVLPSFSLVNRMIGPEWAVAGRLRVRARLSGTVTAPRFVGTLAGRDLAMAQRRLGWRFTDGRLDARFDGDRLEVARLRLNSGEGSIELSGTLMLDGLRGDFRLLADRLPVPIGPGQRIVVSGDTQIVSEAAELKWFGTIRADEGLIELRGGEAPSLPDDVVLIGGPAPGASGQGNGGQAGRAQARASDAQAAGTVSAMRLSADLKMDLGRDIRVRGSGVDARLTGTLQLTGTLPEAPRAIGTVRIRDGTYSAYGQTLEISRGRVIFNGPLDNPVLDITAMRRGAAVEAGVAVTGTVLSPRIRLVSEPDVPDAQKLSWLVLGTGPDAARSGSQLVALQAAAATLFGSEGGSFVSDLQQSLGLDVLTIRNAAASGFDANFGASFPGQAGTGSTPATGATQDVIAIGKRLSSRMMVTYEQGLRGVWSLLRFQYDITRRFSVRAQTGTDTALDLLYFYSFD